MGLYDPATGTYSDTTYALDTATLQENGSSIFDSAANIVTKGVPLTALSIINSFANTGIKIANFFGAEVDEWSTAQQAKDYLGDDTAQYYQQNEGAVDFAGLAIGSFIPGMAGLKALKAIQATGESGLVFGRALGVFTANRSKIIADAAKVISEGEGALFPTLTAEKYKAIALGFGEQALQGFVWETATLATMRANPILNQMDLNETVANVAFGAAFGGVIGGGFEALGVLKQFGKLRQEAILNTNKFEDITKLGGQEAMYSAGDRAALMIDSMQAIPTQNRTPLASARANSAITNASESAKKSLQTLAPGETPDVANSLFDSVNDFVKSGKASTDDAYDIFSRLAKVSRISDDPAVTAQGSVPTGETFFINRFSKKGQAEANFGDMVSSTPHPDANLTRVYRLTTPGDRPVVESFHTDTVLPDGTTVPKFQTATEAFAANPDIDVFIDKRFGVFVNPKSERITQIAPEGEGRILSAKEEVAYRATGKLLPDSKPLTGAPVIYNRLTGALSDNAIPVVGDLGAPSLINDGLLVGTKLYPQTLDSIITPATDSIQANSRYVWAGLRGVKAGDKIAHDDIAMLEQLRREMIEAPDPAKYSEMRNRQGVQLKRGDEQFAVPHTVADLEDIILDAKNTLAGELLHTDSKLSVSDLSRRVNAPEDYFADGLKAKSFDEATIPLEQNVNIQHIKLEYDLNNITRLDEGMVARGAIDVQYRIKVIKDAAITALSGYAGPKAEGFLINATSQQIGVEGAGANFFGAANAGYQTAKQQFERVGRVVADWVQEKNKVIAETLYPHIQALRNDPVAAQEANFFNFIRRTTSENFQFIPPQLAQQYKLGADTAVLSKSLVRNARGEIIDWDRNLVPNGFKHPAAGDTSAALRTYYELSPKVADYERANLQINNSRVVERNNWWTANGMAPKLQPDILYAPPIDTNKYPFFAMVQQKSGQGWADNSVAVITAKSAEELQQKTALINTEDFNIFTKDQIKQHHEVMGDYDYQRNFAQNTVNSDLRRRGILNDLVPDVGVEGLVRDIIDFHSKQELRMARDYTELGNGQLFAELRAMGQRYSGTETSKVGFQPSMFGRTADNPYQDMVKTALAISPKENYRLWADANEKVESFFSTAFSTAKNSFKAARAGVIPFEQANSMAQSMGLGNVYGAMTDAAKSYEAIAAMLPPQRYLSKFVATANSVMAATAIRLDSFQALINAVSTPVLMLAEAHSANKAIQDMLSTALPTTNRIVPSTTKLMFQAVASFVKNDGERQALTPVLKEIGAIKDNMADYYRMVDNITLPYGKLSESQWVERAQKAVELGSKYTGNNLAEEMSRYVPGYVANKIFTAAGYTGQELKDNIATFVNRVQGNYAAAQRPVAFQGPIGQAIGLFQTYQVNLLQQMMRYAADGEGKSLAILAGAQTTLFGVNGLPGFQAINQHLIGAAPGNPSHADAYSAFTSGGISSPNPLQRSVGDYILYGALSNILSTGLYSRGDINPRNVTVLPINPLDFPAVSGGIKLVSSLIDTGQKIAQGGSVPTSLLLGLEHNGLSRPLAGLAQLAQGYVTTGQGGIVASTRPGMGNNESGFSDLASIANFSRLLGARPLDEAIVLDTMYRSTLYKAKDHTRIEQLGESFKTQAYGGQQVDADTVNAFAAKYAAAGGNVTTFAKSIISWTNQSNVSVANSIYKQLQTPANQNYIRAMGGVKLPDFSSYNTGVPAQTVTTE